MKLLVTGGSGFIGSHLIERLGAENEIVNVDIVQQSSTHKSQFVNCDITDYKMLAEKLGDKVKNFDAIVHLAALSREVESNKNPEVYFKTNVDGTINMLRIARDFGIKKFIFASTYLVYGDRTEMPVNEETVLNPRSIYASTKAAAEFFCNSFRYIYGIDSIIFRQALVYGKNDLEKRVVKLFIEKARNGEKISVFGNKILDFIHVSDVVDAYTKALSYSKSDTFNLASGKGISLVELADSVKKIINPNVEIQKEQQHAGDVSTFIADISKSRNILGFEPKNNLIEFIESEK